MKKIVSDINTQKEVPPDNLNGTSDAFHIISVIITAVCSVLMIVLVNMAFLSKTALCIICAVIITVLLVCNALIYRRVVKKIFEHFSIVFTAAGAVTLLFVPLHTFREAVFICCLALLLAGAVLMLLYGVFYHKHG